MERVIVGNRNVVLDQVRCVANYLIILMHSGAALQYCPKNSLEVSFWTFACGCITQIALPALFLISGYLLFLNYSFAGFKQKIVRRIKRLFVPYIMWNMTFVVFYLLLGKYVPRLSDRITAFGLDTFQGAFSKIISFTVHPIDGPLWFLRTLFVLSLVSPLFYVLFNSKKTILKYSGLLIIAFGYIAFYFWGITDKLLMTYPLYSIALFYLGGVLATSGKTINSLRFDKSIWQIIAIIGVSMLTFVLFNPGFEHTPIGGTINDLGKLLLTPVLFYIVGKFNNERLNSSKFFLFAKDMSFFAYAGHFLFCSMIMHTVASHVTFMGNGKATLLILVFCLIGIPVMALVYRLGKIVMPKLMKLFDGTL